jgi:outer membrane protein assembly factor BamA
MRTLWMLLALVVVQGAVPAAGEETARLRWGKIEIESSAPIDSVAWFRALDLEGRYVDEAPIDAAIVRALRIFAEVGYPFAEARPRSFDLEDGKLVGTIHLDLGAEAVIEDIQLSGARVTKPKTVFRLIGMEPGRRYTGREGAMVRERLARSGLFSSVGEVKVLPGSSAGAVVLEVPVTEPPYTRFRGALGVSGEEATLTGLLDLDLTNIAGTARAASGRWENRGLGLTRFALHYREPWLPVVPIGLEGDLQHDVNENRYSYTRWEITGDISWRSIWRIRAGRGGSQAVEIDGPTGTQSESYFVGGVTYDGRNSAANPTAGIRFFLNSTRGTKTVPIDTLVIRLDRTRWDLGGEGYQRVGSRWLGVLRTRFQYLDTPEDSIPRWDLFAVGGANSLRGYREEQFLTPGAWVTQTEWRWLQGNQGSAVYVFADAAFISPPEGREFEDTFDQFQLGTGLGLRQAGKLGIVSVEYGVARGDSPLDGRLHLRIDAVF